jgi:hypothetical protein
VLPELTPEVWTATGIVGAALLGGTVGKVWKPLRRTVAAIDVVAGRPERYHGDAEARPGLAERLDNIDNAIRGIETNVNAVRSEVDTVKAHVQNLEAECPS